MVIIIILLLATPREDYLPPATTVNALTSQHRPDSDLCFKIPLVPDEFVELTECFGVSISVADNSLMVSIAGGQDTALYCIQDDDRKLITCPMTS